METLQPKLRFPEFDGDWSLDKLGNEIEIISGYAFKGELFGKKGNKLVIPKNFTKFGNGNFSSGFSKYTTEVCDDKYLCAAGDLLVLLTDLTQTCELLGKPLLLKEEDGKVYLNQRVIKIFTTSTLDKTFLMNFFLTEKYHNYIFENASGSTVRHSSNKTIQNTLISYPSFREQNKIANFLSAVDEKLNLLKEKKSLLEEYKKGIMQKIFNQEIRFKDDDGNDFEEWQEKSLGEIGTFQTSSIDKLIKEDEEEVYLVNYMNVYRHENINNETKKYLQVVSAKENQIISSNLKKGDILFTPSSETPDDIGHSVVIFEDLDKCVYSYHLMRFRPIIELDLLYSHYFCNNSKVLIQLTRLATGSTRFTISVKSFSSVLIDLPCLAEQIKIANFLSAIDEKIELVSTQIEDTQEYKKGLLQQMFV